MQLDRYHRQTILPGIGPAGQAKIAAATVMIVGVGALGTVSAEYLARAGVGKLILIDRDIVERTNLQRQLLFDESHADGVMPKAVAAAERINAINSEIEVTPLVTDFDGWNAHELMHEHRNAVIVDGTDNAETRFLINYHAFHLGMPWIYGACVGTVGRAMGISYGDGPCLECIFPKPPAAGELETCETAGVLGPAAGVVASIQATLALQTIVNNHVAPKRLTSFDLATGRFHVTDVSNGKRPECICDPDIQATRRPARSVTRLCGRNTIQLRLNESPSFGRLETYLAGVGTVARSEHAIAFHAKSGESLTVFIDGRVLVHQTNDTAIARSIVARFLGG